MISKNGGEVNPIPIQKKNKVNQFTYDGQRTEAGIAQMPGKTWAEKKANYWQNRYNVRKKNS